MTARVPLQFSDASLRSVGSCLSSFDSQDAFGIVS
jgi:hypothetical protein